MFSVAQLVRFEIISQISQPFSSIFLSQKTSQDQPDSCYSTAPSSSYKCTYQRQVYMVNRAARHGQGRQLSHVVPDSAAVPR
jgi:hypothetical protein